MRILGRLRPTPAMVVALIALFVAMGGIGYAAAKIGSKDIKVNAVKSRHIANGAVTKKAIHKGAVVGVKIANGTVTGRKLASNSIRASKLAGTVDGLNSVNVPANATASTTVTCPAGGQALSGGFSTLSPRMGAPSCRTLPTQTRFVTCVPSSVATIQSHSSVTFCCSLERR